MTVTTKFQPAEQVFVFCLMEKKIKRLAIRMISIQIGDAGVHIEYHLNHPHVYTENQLFSTADKLLDFLKKNIQYETL